MFPTVCKCLGVTSRFKSQKGMAFVFIVNDIWTAYISDPFTPGEHIVGEINLGDLNHHVWYMYFYNHFTSEYYAMCV